MDESSKQQIKEVRTPILINQAKCYDTEYERNVIVTTYRCGLGVSSSQFG